MILSFSCLTMNSHFFNGYDHHRLIDHSTYRSPVSELTHELSSHGVRQQVRTIPREKHRIIEQSVISNGNFESTAKLLVYAAINLAAAPHCPPRLVATATETMYPEDRLAPRGRCYVILSTQGGLTAPATHVNGSTRTCESWNTWQAGALPRFVMKFLEQRGGNGNGDLISVDHDFKVNNRPRTFNIPFKRYTFRRARNLCLLPRDFRRISMDSFEIKYLSYL